MVFFTRDSKQYGGLANFAALTRTWHSNVRGTTIGKCVFILVKYDGFEWCEFFLTLLALRSDYRASVLNRCDRRSCCVWDDIIRAGGNICRGGECFKQKPDHRYCFIKQNLPKKQPVQHKYVRCIKQKKTNKQSESEKQDGVWFNL